LYDLHTRKFYRMKLLVVGSGAREHALGWKLSQSPLAPQLFFAPGNPGMEALGTRVPLAADDIAGLLAFAQANHITLTVVGPELPLSQGIVDRFMAAGLTIFGPTQAAAQMESSKSFAKTLMCDAGVPTALSVSCHTEAEALAALDQFSAPYVIKQDGLAAGKGVRIAANRAEAESAIHASFLADDHVLIEQFLLGEELSVFALCDGTRAVIIGAAQDYKRVGDGNQGPNTGGMGAYAPVPFATEACLSQVQHQVFDPVLKALNAKGIAYRGLLYAGLMISPDGVPNVIEFNARFGDPETQVILPMMADDLLPLLLASAQGDLSGVQAKPTMNQAAITVVMAAHGYPDTPEKGGALTVPTHAMTNDQLVFHAGTQRAPEGTLVADGGRVLSVTGLGPTLAAARACAYGMVESIHFPSGFFRRDIGLVK
jgi:phosphoribosylamine---glycine ligase